MKIEVSKKNLEQMQFDFSRLLGEAIDHKQKFKNIKGKLGIREQCDCGRIRYNNTGMDFKEFNDNQQEYIDYLRLTYNRIKAARKKAERRK